MKAGQIPSRLTISLGVLLSLFSPGLFGRNEGQRARPDLGPFFKKEAVTVAVMDSGLGGLSVLAEAVQKMKAEGTFRSVDFVFFNALFSNEGGYNSLKTRSEKIRVFDSALESLARNFRPDIVLIACNTLSVLYGETAFSKRAGRPVFVIVEPGVELIAAGLRSRPEASVIIFGTPTTISEGTYPARLEDQGFAAARLHGQSCPELESFIENDPQSEETAMLISGFVSEAVQKLASPPPPLMISLNCTHYGYSLPLWEKALDEAGVKPLSVLNPNPRLTEVLFNSKYRGRFDKTAVKVRVVSMVEVIPRKIESLAPWLGQFSPETAMALRHYEKRPRLFKWEGLISR